MAKETKRLCECQIILQKQTYISINCFFFSNLRYNETSHLWEARHSSKLYFLATSTAPRTSLLLGSYNWTITNDNPQCNENSKHTRSLTLTPCNENEFTCSGGKCIPMDERCDRRAHCVDSSDELHCDIVDKGQGYNKLLTPIAQHTSGSLKVNVTIDIENILGIDEVEGSFLVKFSIKRV